MKRNSLFLAAFLVLGGMFRLPGPSSPSSARASSGALAPAGKSPAPSSAAKAPAPTRPADAFERSLIEAISAFYGNRPSSSAPSHFASTGAGQLGSEARETPRFLIALVPDPLHTHLSLLFDRTVRSIQMGIQADGTYSFDRAVLPWKHTARKDNETPVEHDTEELERKQRESYPGLLMFRGPSPLFVFVVGEKPTSGINNLQFQNAIQIIRALRPASPRNAAAVKPPLLIVGPSFSGSLESLHAQLTAVRPERDYSEILVYSGSTTNRESEESFKEKFPQKNTVPLRFASFQQNDEYAIGQFVRFAYCKGYSPKEIAVLSEGDTAYGNISGSALPSAVADHGKDSKFKLSDLLHPYCTDGQTEKEFDGEVPEIVHLAFPREISFFRSAYQKEQASRQESLAKIPGKSAIPLNLDDEGDEGDAVPPFAGPQTALSQEAVMLGVVSELQKHHIKFTILLATNPVDQLFLARYLRTSYPQGRVVVTTPDLLLVSQEDTLLQGVLGLNVYSLVPGQNDLLGDSDSAQSRVAESVGNSGRKIQHKAHQDRLFESATDVGTFNATLALLAAGQIVERTANARKDSAGHPQWDRTKLPPADYAEYAAPCRREPSTNNSEECPSEPMLWLTILGADGYWPIAALSDQVKKSDDPRLPISYAISGFPLPQRLPNTLLTVESTATPGSGQAPHRTKEPSHTTPAWKVAYSLCVLAFLIHAILSCTGSFLSSSEAQAQFANTREKYRSLVVAAGAVILVAAFVLIRCARSPLVSWRGGHLFDAAFWAPLPLFVGVICWDLIARRRAAMTAAAFFATASAVTAFQVSLATEQIPLFPFLWSTRYLHFTSAVSPIPPFFFLLVACYWWTWLSLRGMSIVDLRRPRLPSPSTLPSLAARMSDQEGEKVRDTAHPVKFAWKILIVILAVALVSITLLDLRHPLQSLEGFVYDWGYCALLAVAIAVYLGCLIRLTTTWFSYKQVLAGLDRSPLREAFSRMKRLSWKSLWNPGGSTLRETYRVMSRTFENLEKLEPAIPNSAESKHIRASIKDTNTAYFEAIAIYGRLLHATEPSSASAPGATTESSSAPASTVDASAAAAEGDSPAPQAARVAVPQGVSHSVPSAAMASAAGVAPARDPAAEFESTAIPPQTIPNAAGPNTDQTDEETSKETKETKFDLSQLLVCQIECLQIRMADTAGYLIRDLLTPLWRAEQEPVVSVDRRIKKADLPLFRALAEEYAALVYVNFLQSVLLQMRTLVICAAGMYVFILCSISVYPFEPHPALQVLAVALLVAMGAIVGFVYAEMHRDAILGRLTSTNAGELGWDFWWKFISAGAVPVFSLLAVQFPEIGRFLFSWLAPALQAVK